jgi:hypothetical protein
MLTWGEHYRRSRARGWDHGYAAWLADRHEERVRYKSVETFTEGQVADNNFGPATCLVSGSESGSDDTP